jgi:hypothetical protein
MKGNLLVVMFVSLFAGCASIPPEAPELSAELGKRISAIEDSNLMLLHRFFDQKREAVDKFVEDEWVPLFAEEFFSDRTISDAWDTVVREDNKKQRLTFIVKIGPKLQKKINEKRLELIQPLDDLERGIEKKIRDEYTQARSVNNSITSFLLSASKVAENRNRYLEVAGVKDSQIGKLIEQTDDTVADLLSKTKGANEKIDGASKYLEKIRSIRNSI